MPCQISPHLPQTLASGTFKESGGFYVTDVLRFLVFGARAAEANELPELRTGELLRATFIEIRETSSTIWRQLFSGEHSTY